MQADRKRAMSYYDRLSEEGKDLIKMMMIEVYREEQNKASKDLINNSLVVGQVIEFSRYKSERMR